MKKVLVKSEVKVLNFISNLQDIVCTADEDGKFDELMNNYLKNTTKEMTEDELIRLKITLLNLEELNLIAGDVLNSPHITKEGRRILSYYNEREKIVQRCVGGLIMTTFTVGIFRLCKKFFSKEER